MRKLGSFVWGILSLALLASCGGGGGGSTPGGGGDSPGVPPAAVFSPPTIVTSYETGTSSALTVRATVSTAVASATSLYIYVVDSSKVLSGGVDIVAINSNTFDATIRTSPLLDKGRYSGSFLIQFCRDSACTSQFSGSPVSLPYDFQVTAGLLHFGLDIPPSLSIVKGANSTTRVVVSVTGKQGWTASTAAPWMVLSNGTGTGNGSFSVDFKASTAAVGHFVENVVVRAADGQVFNIPFTLDVLPVQFVSESGTLNFNAVNGSTIDPALLDIHLNNGLAAPWNAVVGNTWLKLAASSGTTPSVIQVQPDPSVGPLSSGTYSSTLTLTASGIDTKLIPVNLSLLKATLSSSSPSIVLGGLNGRDLNTVGPLVFNLNTDSKKWPWSIADLPSWLSVTNASGTVDQSGKSVSFQGVVNGLAAGSYSANVKVAAKVNGDSVELPVAVSMNIDQRRLIPSEWGIGFAETPNGKTLKRTVKISDNFKLSLPWTATADKPWLSVTSTGNTTLKPDLTMTVDPTGLDLNKIHYANVRISTTTTNVSDALVRVAVWLDTTSAKSMSAIPLKLNNIVADKIRPLVYVNANGSSIDIYNVFTATKIAAISESGKSFGPMAVSPDGTLLYALSAMNSLSIYNLDDLSKIGEWTLDSTAGLYDKLVAIRSNGMDLLVTGSGTIFAGGKVVARLPSGYSGSVAGTSDGSRLYFHSQGISPSTVQSFSLDYTSLNGGSVLFSKLAENSAINNSSYGADVAVSGDGKYLYIASGAPYLCSSIDPNSLSFISSLPGGGAYPNNVEVTSDGRIICGIAEAYTEADFWVHTAGGSLLSQFRVTGYSNRLLPAQLVASPDGTVVVTLTDDPRIVFVPIGK
jgi:hypothetical protein